VRDSANGARLDAALIPSPHVRVTSRKSSSAERRSGTLSRDVEWYIYGLNCSPIFSLGRTDRSPVSVFAAFNL
jgi:hypothetical protein